jgi:O-acetyl-ADP-ribose deacetylase (regulator of RNase III)
MITEQRQDLFAVNYRDEYCLCHCVSEDLAMGKGIAVLFRDKFGGFEELRKQVPRMGGVCSLPSGSMRIYYLITKPKYWNKPTYETLHASLVTMRNDMKQGGLSKIAMPRIGCGLDGLHWDRVKTMVSEVFTESGIDVLICSK